MTELEKEIARADLERGRAAKERIRAEDFRKVVKDLYDSCPIISSHSRDYIEWSSYAFSRLEKAIRRDNENREFE